MIKRPGKSRPIGLDLGSSALRMIQLEGEPSRPVISAAAEFAFPPERRRSKERAELMVSALKDLLKSRPFKGRDVITVIPSEIIQYRSFRLPQMPPEELQQVVQFEAQERFAFEDEHSEYRFLHAGQVRQGQDIREEVIAMGVPGKALTQYLEMFEKAKINCLNMEISPCAVARCLEQTTHTSQDSGSARVYVDFGHHATHVTITRQGEIVFIKAVDVGSGKFHELMAKHLNLSITEAAQLRHEILKQHHEGSVHPSRVETEILEAAKVAIQPAVEQLGKEIGLCLRYYSVTFRGVRPEELICVGGECYDAHLRNALAELVGIPALIAAPFQSVDCNNAFTPEQQKRGLLEWTTALGLGLKSLSTAARQKVYA